MIECRRQVRVRWHTSRSLKKKQYGYRTKSESSRQQHSLGYHIESGAEGAGQSGVCRQDAQESADERDSERRAGLFRREPRKRAAKLRYGYVERKALECTRAVQSAAGARVGILPTPSMQKQTERGGSSFFSDEKDTR